MSRNSFFFVNSSARVWHSRAPEDMFDKRVESNLPEESRDNITNPVKRAPRRSANAWETPVEGTLQRLPVPERAPRNTSLRVEETPRDKGAHDYLLLIERKTTFRKRKGERKCQHLR